MLKQDTYLINIARALFKLSNLKQPIYHKFRPEIIANYGSFIAHHDSTNYKLLQDYYKLQQKFITNYGSFITNYDNGILQITAVLLQITTMGYYKLRQKFITNYDKKLLQIMAALIFKKFKIITNYVQFYYISRQFLVLLQTRKFYIRRNNNKVDSVDTGRIVIADLFP